MFGPQTADSIELSAHYYRKESEQWAANARLARLALANEPSLLARALRGLGSLLRGSRPAEKAEALATPRPLAPVTALRSGNALAESENDRLEEHPEAAAA